MKVSERLSRAIKNPRLFARGLNRAYYRRGGLRPENINGLEVFDEDWDTLVVLDACRYDMFEQENFIEGTLSAKTSRGSATSEWLRANLDGRDLRDTVYVTANPQLERNRENIDVTLHEVINVWLDEGWDEEKGTVLADTVTEAAIEANQQFPNKRLVVHYMQPHYPFVPTDTSFDKEHLASIEDGDDDAVGENVWDQLFMGEIDWSQEEVWEAYTANLEYVLYHVEELLDGISGRTIITSDHGNYVGERASPIPIREYGHPRGVYDEPVIQVPWLIFETDNRRRIVTSSEADTREDIEDDTVAERLRDLGYHE